MTYHHVDNVSDTHPQRNLYIKQEEFRRQMEFLRKKGYTVVSLDDIKASLSGEKIIPPKSVAITFDDGFEDNYLNAFPIIREYGYPATIFVIAGKIRTEKETYSREEGNRYLSLRQMQDMTRSGVTIGSHGLTHRRLARIPPEEARREIFESREILEQSLGCPIRWFCYPFGSFSKSVVSLVCEAGYSGALSVIRDNRITSRQIYFLPRVMVMPGISNLHFRYYFSRFYHYLHRWKNRKRWDPHIRNIVRDTTK
jgi:peptidoglycan/xylan/chitin deacetylase (PgdA/CDA1 family)